MSQTLVHGCHGRHGQQRVDRHVILSSDHGPDTQQPQRGSDLKEHEQSTQHQWPGQAVVDRGPVARCPRQQPRQQQVPPPGRRYQPQAGIVPDRTVPELASGALEAKERDDQHWHHRRGRRRAQTNRDEPRRPGPPRVLPHRHEHHRWPRQRRPAEQEHGFERYADGRPDRQAHQQAAADRQRRLDRNRDARQPAERPQMVRPELHAIHEERAQQPGPHRRPQADPRRKQPPPDQIDAPELGGKQRHHGQAHPDQQVRSITEQAHQRPADHVKQRHVVVEQVPILQQPVRPPPRHVQVLRLVTVDFVAEDVDPPQQDRRRQEGPRRGCLDALPRHPNRPVRQWLARLGGQQRHQASSMADSSPFHTTGSSTTSRPQTSAEPGPMPPV